MGLSSMERTRHERKVRRQNRRRPANLALPKQPSRLKKAESAADRSVTLLTRPSRRFTWCRVGASLLARIADNAPSCGRGGFVGDAETEMFDVVDGLIEEHRDVVVVERVNHAAPVADAGHQPHRAQKA
jgi:hypothetical protein